MNNYFYDFILYYVCVYVYTFIFFLTVHFKYVKCVENFLYALYKK